ncbi:MAG: rhodanese-like domain-containing protein, partial [Oceanococcaceae bacterium]
VARWSPIDRGEEGLAALALDPAQPVLLYCRSGGRAEKAGQWLQQMGHTQVRVLRPGGFAELKASGLPTE